MGFLVTSSYGPFGHPISSIRDYLLDASANVGITECEKTLQHPNTRYDPPLLSHASCSLHTPWQYGGPWKIFLYATWSFLVRLVVWFLPISGGARTLARGGMGAQTTRFLEGRSCLSGGRTLLSVSGTLLWGPSPRRRPAGRGTSGRKRSPASSR